MPVQSAVVGHALTAISVDITPRMVLAFSAGIGDDADASFDDLAPGFAASPMFCAALEWRLVVAARNALLGVTPAESRQVVHVGQDSRFVRPLPASGRMLVGGEILGVRRTRAGALSSTRLDITDARSGLLLSSTYSNALYRGVEVEGPDRGAPPGVDGEETARDAADSRETTLELDRWFAHRYSECANIWNPIHTERTVAKQAGLPDIIVHGTALWALAGCVLISRFAPNQPQRLRRLSGRFSAMVPAGTPITIRHARAAVDPHTALFSVINAQGQEAVSGGVATFSET